MESLWIALDHMVVAVPAPLVPEMRKEARIQFLMRDHMLGKAKKAVP